MDHLNRLPVLPDPFGPMRERDSKVKDATLLMADVQRASFASVFAERLILAANRFSDSLAASQEVGVRLVNFGQTITFHVHDIRYHNPSLIFFRGVMDDGSHVELVQHVSQISFLLLAVPKLDPDAPKRKYGFQPPDPQAPTDEAPERV